MANNNNIYFNAAFCGFMKANLKGRKPVAVVAGLKGAAAAFAAAVDALIPVDALVTTNAAATQLAITTNTIAANEQFRAGLLKDLCEAGCDGMLSTDSTQADWTPLATAIVAQWNDAIGSLVTP